MPSIVVINDEGSVLYQNVVEDVQDLVKIIRDGRNVPGYALDDCPEVQVNGLIVLAGQPPKPKMNKKDLELSFKVFFSKYRIPIDPPELPPFSLSV